MRTFHFSKEFITRFSAYLASDKKSGMPNYSKSQYWQEQSKLINVSVSDQAVIVSGNSGYYIPPGVWTVAYLRRMIKEAIFPFINRFKALGGGRIEMLNYNEAFEAIMSHKPISHAYTSQQRVDFTNLRNNPRAVLSIKDMRRKYFAKEKYRVNEQVIFSYYLWNILCVETPLDDIKTVLEIGPGSGNLSALLHHQLKARVLCVDLAETLCLSMLFIADCFPNAKILMPHELTTAKIGEYDFIFLTPQQIHLVPDNLVDLAVNTDSFQEMTAKQVEEYFKLIQRSTKNGGYFLTQNRVEKFLSQSDDLPLGEVVSRFSEYPWQEQNETVIYQICRFCRLVQPDDCFIKLEKIVK